jgi:hypothetical protein
VSDSKGKENADDLQINAGDGERPPAFADRADFLGIAAPGIVFPLGSTGGRGARELGACLPGGEKPFPGGGYGP